MKSIVVYYDIFSDKLSTNQRVVLISDIHDAFSKKKLQNQLVKDINDLKPHHTSISGDVMQGVKYADLKKCNQLSYFLDSLAEAQPVVLSLGNHDLVGLTEYGRENFRNLGNHKQVFPLDNESIILDNFRITGFSPNRKAYDSSYHKSGLANQSFSSDWNKSSIDIDKNSSFFEELLCHAPHPLASTYVQENANGIRNFDLYLSGHLHDGYIPYWYKKNHLPSIQDFGVWEMPIERNENGKITFIRPYIYDKINLCRGMHYIGSDVVIFEDGSQIGNFQSEEETTPLVISSGVNKLFGLPSFPEIICIDIHPKEKVLNSKK